MKFEIEMLAIGELYSFNRSKLLCFENNIFYTGLPYS